MLIVIDLRLYFLKDDISILFYYYTLIFFIHTKSRKWEINYIIKLMMFSYNYIIINSMFSNSCEQSVKEFW